MFSADEGLELRDAGAFDRVAVLDRVHLAGQALGDDELAREVIAMFMDQAADMLRAIRDAGSGRERRDAAHRLKGSARAVGAFRVAAAAEALEELADQPDEDALLDGVAALHASVAEAISVIAAELAGPDSRGL